MTRRGASGVIFTCCLLTASCAELLGIDDLDFSSKSATSSGSGGASSSGVTGLGAGAAGNASSSGGGSGNVTGGVAGSGGNRLTSAGGGSGYAASPAGVSGNEGPNDAGAASGGGGGIETGGVASARGGAPDVSMSGGDGSAGAQGGGLSGGTQGCAADAKAAPTCRPSACVENPCGGYLWVNGVVPYQVDSSLPAPVVASLDAAARAWSRDSAVDFARCQNDDCAARGHSRWLDVRLGAQPSLAASAAEGSQLLELPATITHERIAHELGHVIGLPDVWRRPDRDRYVKLSESAFCVEGGHWDASVCTGGSPEPLDEPYRRGTGQFGAFDSNSAMNLAGPEVCEDKEPDVERELPTNEDRSAATELYRTAEGWSPFAPLARDVGQNAPLAYTLAANVQVVGTPALASRNYPQLDVYARGSDQQLYVKFRPFASAAFGDWYDWQSLGCCFDSDPAAISWNFEHTELFARSTSGDIRWRTLGMQAGSNYLVWSNWRSLDVPATGAASGPAVASAELEQIELFVRGSDDLLYHKRYAHGWAESWNQVSSEPFVGTPSAAARRGGRIDVVVATAAGGLRRHSFDGLSWSVPQSLDGPIQPGTSPALVAGVDALYLYVQTPLHRLAQRVLTGDDWGPWRDLGGVLVSSPAAVGNKGRPHVDVAATVSDQGEVGVWLRSWPYVRPCYVGAASCGECAEPCDGPCPEYTEPAGDPTVYARDTRDDVVVSAASNGHVYEFTRKDEWAIRDLTSRATGAALAAGNPTAYVRSDRSNSIMYRGVDGSVTELFEYVDGWRSGSLSGYIFAPDAVGNPVPYVQIEGQNSVVYRASNAHIYAITLFSQQWVYEDLSNTVGAPDALGDAGPFVRADGADAIVFRDAQNQLHEIFFASSWQLAHISASSAVAAAGDAAPYVRSDARNAVAYRGVDGNVYELSTSASGHTWSATELSDAAGAPPAASDPRAYRRSDGADAIVYRANDGDIYELQRKGARWFATNVSAAAASPLAASRPAPYVRKDGVNTIVYRAVDACLYELALVGGSWVKTLIYDPKAVPATPKR